MIEKTVKQIKNLKAYKEAIAVSVWTAKLIEGDWVWGWYYMDSFEDNNDCFIHKITDKLEYRITL